MPFFLFFGNPTTGIVSAVAASTGVGAAAADASGVAYIRPTTTDLAGGWTDDLGGSALDNALDEFTRNDSDYIQSSSSPVADVCRISLGPVAEYIDGTKTVRLGYTLYADDPAVDITVRLKQLTTLITSWNHTGLTGTPELFVQTLSSVDRAAIDWDSPDDLKLEFEADL